MKNFPDVFLSLFFILLQVIFYRSDGGNKQGDEFAAVVFHAFERIVVYVL